MATWHRKTQVGWRGGKEKTTTSGSVDDSDGHYGAREKEWEKKIDQVAVICHARTRILKDCTVGTKARSVFFDDIKDYSTKSTEWRCRGGGGKRKKEKSNTDVDITTTNAATTNIVLLYNTVEQQHDRIDAR